MKRILIIISTFFFLLTALVAQKDTVIVNKLSIKKSFIQWENKVFVFQFNSSVILENVDLCIKNCDFIGSKSSNIKVLSGKVNITNCTFREVDYFQNIDGNEMIIEGCNFINCKKGISIRVGSKNKKGKASILKNRFEDCIYGLEFRNQIKKRVKDYTLNISCNEFIKTAASGNTQLTAIYVEPNTRMVDIGNCPTTQNPNLKPAGNDIIDASNTMRSIWNLGTNFEYSHWKNENINLSQSLGIQFSDCSIDADNNTCIGSPGILNRPIVSNNEEEKVGYYADSRYKNSVWFAQSKLGDAKPNPASNVIIIPVTLSEENRTVKLIVYNAMGSKNLIEKQLKESGKIILDVSGLASGMYFYSLMINNVIVDTKKLIIEK